MDFLKGKTKWDWVIAVLLTVITLMAIQFIVFTKLHRFFEFTKEAYGSSYWEHAKTVFFHVAFGVVVLLLGPIQFSTVIRKKWPKFHRVSGRVYLIGILVSSGTALYLSAVLTRPVVWRWGLGSMASVCLICGILSFYSILRGNIEQHKEWMIRCYAIVFSTMFIRYGNMGLTALEVGKGPERLQIMSWACWSLSLFIVEVFLQMKKIRRV